MEGTWKGYAFFKWRSYYIVGKITEAEITNDRSLDFTKATYGTASFDIVYFSKIPPRGVAKESFAEEDKEIQYKPDLIQSLADKAIEQATIDIGGE